MRTYDLEKIKAAIGEYAKEITGLNLNEWITNDLNIALINDKGDVALFENQIALPYSVCGHYFFFSRGKKAVEASKQFLKEIFSDNYYVQTIVGIVPEETKGALWMSREIGFKEHGKVDSVVGLCRLFILTKEQWKDLNNHE